MVYPVEPHLNEALYLPFEELMKNLQDKGIDDKSGKGTLVFPKLKKIATKMWKLLEAFGQRPTRQHHQKYGTWNKYYPQRAARSEETCQQNICPSKTEGIRIRKSKSSLYFT